MAEKAVGSALTAVVKAQVAAERALVVATMVAVAMRSVG